MAVAVVPKRPPIRLVVRDDELRRSRLTVFFRGLLAIPHILWLALWGIAVGFVSFVNWLAVVITGEVPTSLHDFVAGYLRCATHVAAYVFLAAGPFPGFSGKPGYPVDLEIDPPARQRRLGGLFRFALAVPALTLSWMLGGNLAVGSLFVFTTYGLALLFMLVGGVVGAVALLAWFFSLILGRAPRGLRDLTAYALDYGAQAGGYYLLLTGRYPTSDPAVAERYGKLPEHPVQLVVADDLGRSRLTVLFRLLLTMPHFFWAFLWGIAAYLAAIVAWFVALVTGRVPDALHRFIAAYVRYVTHVYAYLFLVGEKFPGFTGRAGSYGVDVEISPPEPQRRLTTFFRFVLAFPAFLIGSALAYVLYVVAVLAWFYALVTGRMPEGLRNLGASCLRYNAQTYAYLLLVTSRYPYATPVLRDKPEPPPTRPPLPMLLLPSRPAPMPMPGSIPLPPPVPPPAGVAGAEIGTESRKTDYVAVAIIAALVLAAGVLGVLGIRALSAPDDGVLRVVAPPERCWSIASGRDERELLATHDGCGETEIRFDRSGFEAQISSEPPTEEYELGATILVDGEVVRTVAPEIRGGLRVRYGDDMPEKILVIRIEATPEGCWTAIVDDATEDGCGPRTINLGQASTVAFNVERVSRGTWPLFVAVEADGQEVQTFGPSRGEYPRISGGYSVPRPVE